MSTTKLKTLVILDILREKTDAEHRLSVPQLLCEMEKRGIYAERKGIYRDIESLIEHGEDIVKASDGYYLGKRDLDVSELKVLIGAVQAANFITPERSEALMNKLLNGVSKYVGERIRSQANMGGIKCGTDEIMHTIEVLNNAIANRQQVSFAYYKRDVNRKLVRQRSGRRYIVNPYAMIWMMDRYYLVCNMAERDDLTHFRLDRIRALRPEMGIWRHFSSVSDYKSKFDQADYVKRCINMFGDKTRLVTIRCDYSVADEIFDRFGTDIIVRNAANSRFEALINVSAGEGFLSWAAQWGDRIEIIFPTDLRLEMKRRLEKTYELYNKPM